MGNLKLSKNRHYFNPPFEAKTGDEILFKGSVGDYSTPKPFFILMGW
ncbi:MAG: hypothetical protein H0A76_05790 [Candidatus Thiodubiliella endoseptemdiera]|uniref:Uncharacterized protein n=1 Tax=Candidatus Thiodubiliella endoseptemdiera TaxID=2738886 RepID=A0A853F5C6_9GAMM|nr:hypothetical protein [Candidatus Thiodubiliella endoseptemdiera]